ncbi:MAG: hypothetical protein KatS3mg129_0914 [Leptospiraceae bacterium]|nr:MAG: hypothetical protein KatS3mg129_0914 [Leptospiraceae bacterium]
MKKKYIFLDDSILFFLSIQHPIKKEIYEQLSYFIKNNYYPVSSLYCILKIKEIFFEQKQIENFFEFYYDLENLLDKIFPFRNIDLKNTIHISHTYNQDFDLSYYIYLMKENQIYDFQSLQFKEQKKYLQEKFNIRLIYPYY